MAEETRARNGHAWKLQDSFAIFATAMVGFTVESYMGYLLYLRTPSGLAPEVVIVSGQAALLAACTATYWAAQRFLQPVAGLLGGIERFGRGDLRHRIPGSRIRELDELATHLNTMASHLESLDKLKQGIIANVSHELRSPLAAIDGLLALAQADPDVPPQARENLARSSANLARLRRLVDNLLELSQVEAGGLAVEKVPVDVVELAREACELLESQVRARGLRLELDLPAGARRAIGDAGRIRQILVNLLDNAVKYNEDGGRIELRLAAAGGRMEVSVADSGPGIAVEQRHLLFERFRRLPSTSRAASRAKGVGLGLAISRDLARAMGGDLTFDETAQNGCVFRLTLPAEPAEGGF